MSVRLVCRPLVNWPGQLRSPSARRRPPFKATWTSTVTLLEREARMLGAREGVIQLGMDESQLRLDGMPYANAQVRHPGVTVVLPESKVGRISWTTDRYSTWQANVRAIALSMEALRAADRHDVMQGRQYAGFRELGSGIAMEAPMTVEDAARFLIDHGEWGGEPGDSDDVIANPEIAQAYYRQAAKRLHPDAGGDPDLFRRLQDAKVLLERHGGKP